MSCFDRFLATEKGQYYLYDRRNLQLVGMCCLMLAIKVNEPVHVDMSYIDDLSRGSYSNTELRQTENKILVVLGWRMCPPTSSVFIEHILGLFRQDISQSTFQIIRYLCQKQIEIVKGLSFISIKPSIVAMAAVLNMVDLLQLHIPFKLLQDLQDDFLNYHFEIDATCPLVSEIRKILIKQANLIDN